MKRLFEVRLGGGRVHSGLLPVEALSLIQDLMDAMADEGGDPEAWARANAHVEIIGSKSTDSAVLTEEYSELVGPAQLFALKAAEHNLGSRGRKFVDRYFRPGLTWDFAELTVCNENRPRAVFNAEYRETVRQEHQPIAGSSEFYARVVRVGGEKPTAKLEIGGQSGTFPVASQDLAKKLANSLFETVKIRADASWDSGTLEIIHLIVTGIDEDWEDVHLADVVARHGGTLPLHLSFKSAAELLQERRDAREEN